MTESLEAIDVNWRIIRFYLFLLLIVAYLLVTFLTTPSPFVLAYYHLTEAKYRLVIVSVVVPLVAIWAVAYYGYDKLQKYADTIKANKDGRAVVRLTKGVMYLVMQLPLVSLINGILGRIAQSHHGFIPTDTIISHYVQLVPPLVAFILISYGARGLTESVKKRPSQRATFLLATLFIVVAGGFVYFAFRGLPTTIGVSSGNQPQFYLPNWLLFFSVIVPSIFTWFIGVLAAYEVYLFQSKVSGILFKRAWAFLGAGFGWIIFSSIVFQYITIVSSHLTRLHINGLLLVVYAALVILAIGYGLMAIGANRLQKIEEV